MVEEGGQPLPPRWLYQVTVWHPAAGARASTNEASQGWGALMG